MPKVTVTCDRRGELVDGIETEAGTGGFYRVGPGSAWEKYARPGELVICDACMWEDHRYRADYGVHPTPESPL